MTREQRLVFGEDPELYDQARAGYAPELVDAVMQYARVPAGGRAVEIGAGTGKATVAFARTGWHITALEPSPEMAAVAVRNCAGLPQVSVVVAPFEEWDAPPGSCDLVFAAQSWHWIDPGVRYTKAANLLADEGTLALMWHRTNWSGEALRAELDELYGRVDPELRARNPGFPGLDRPEDDGDLIEEISGTGLFGDVAESTFPRTDSFSADQFVNLLATQSDHRLLAPARREALFDEVRRLIQRHGGRVEVPHATWLVLARRRS